MKLEKTSKRNCFIGKNVDTQVRTEFFIVCF